MLTDKEIFGQNLKRLRAKKSGLKRPQLAEDLDIGTSTLRNYENGVTFPQPSILERITEALDVSTYELFKPSEASSGESGAWSVVVEHEQGHELKMRFNGDMDAREAQIEMNKQCPESWKGHIARICTEREITDE